QAEDGIRDGHVTGVQTCALPISAAVTNVNVYATTWTGLINAGTTPPGTPILQITTTSTNTTTNTISYQIPLPSKTNVTRGVYVEIGRASCRERVEIAVGGGRLKK